jgi:hypothetical protein
MPRKATLVLPTIDTCRWRKSMQDSAVCELVGSLVGASSATVSDAACVACCQSFPPSPRQLNPVVASLLYHASCGILNADGNDECNADQADTVKQRAERSLNIIHGAELTLLPARATTACCWLGEPLSTTPLAPMEDQKTVTDGSAREPKDRAHACSHPNHDRTTLANCRICRDWTLHRPVSRFLTLDELIPPPNQHSEPSVKQWAVAVTTAPRRDATLESCLDALVAAGWDSPRLFLDGTAPLPQRYAHLPVTWREDSVGAWPSWYFALAELVMHQPKADAYVMLQDDVVLYHRASLREYLERVLWPGIRPGLIALFYTGQGEKTGWFEAQGAWHFSAQGLIFPPGIARAFLSDPDVLQTLLAASSETHIPIPEIVHRWVNYRGIDVWYANPSLAQHIGNSSTIWMNASIIKGRRAPWFSGSIEAEFGTNESLDQFPEAAFDCDPAVRDEYHERLASGKVRMRELSVVICGLCRDVRVHLPRTAARVERLGTMFAKYRVVLFENDSVDATCEFLADWRSKNPCVDFVSESAGVPKYPQTRSLERANWMAHCRNRYREQLLRQYSDYDYVIVLDTDLMGGWSYDGIAHSFGMDDWDVMGSYGLQLRKDSGAVQSPFVHFDVWAFHPARGTAARKLVNHNELLLKRGDPLLPVESSFGGLGLYRMACMQAAEYGGSNCEHVVFHKRLRQAGFDRLYLNPSQIVLYSPH